MLKTILLSPPITFIIFLALGMLFSYLGSLIGAVGADSAGKYTSYACGQAHVPNHVSPDYSQFFPYAFFFTIMHVLVLVMATVTSDVLVLPLLYVGVGFLALFILFRR